MKSSTFLLLLGLFLIPDVRGENAGQDFVYKASAQICKPYFLQCKQSKAVKECFQDVYYRCLPTYRKWLQSVEQCAAEAADDLDAVMSCSLN